MLVRKAGSDTISGRNGIEKPRTEWLCEQMTDEQVAESERLRRQIESEFQKGR